MFSVLGIRALILCFPLSVFCLSFDDKWDLWFITQTQIAIFNIHCLNKSLFADGGEKVAVSRYRHAEKGSNIKQQRPTTELRLPLQGSFSSKPL